VVYSQFDRRAVAKFEIHLQLIQTFFRLVAWLLAVAIFLLSVGPPSTRPVTGAGHNFEHLLIFVAMGGAFYLGYRCRISLLLIALTAFAGAVELAQAMVPGRHARLSDFLIDAAASFVGIGLSSVLVKLTTFTFKKLNRGC
jgi:VanZ like protein